MPAQANYHPSYHDLLLVAAITFFESQFFLSSLDELHTFLHQQSKFLCVSMPFSLPMFMCLSVWCVLSVYMCVSAYVGVRLCACNCLCLCFGLLRS